MNFFTILSIFLIFPFQFSSLVLGDGSDIDLGKRDATENDLENERFDWKCSKHFSNSSKRNEHEFDNITCKWNNIAT